MAKQSHGTLTAEQAKARLEKQGTTVTAWAIAHDFSPVLVSHVLNGFLKGQRGKARKIAVALGMRASDPDRDAA